MEEFRLTRKALGYRSLDFSTFQARFLCNISINFYKIINRFQWLSNPNTIPTDLRTFMVQAYILVLVLQSCHGLGQNGNLHSCCGLKGYRAKPCFCNAAQISSWQKYFSKKVSPLQSLQKQFQWRAGKKWGWQQYLQKCIPCCKITWEQIRVKFKMKIYMHKAGLLLWV